MLMYNSKIQRGEENVIYILDIIQNLYIYRIKYFYFPVIEAGFRISWPAVKNYNII